MARLRCALLPEKKILSTSFVEIAGPAGVGAFASEVKRSAASHEDEKYPDCCHLSLVLLEYHPHDVDAGIDKCRFAGDAARQIGTQECRGIADFVYRDRAPQR